MEKLTAFFTELVADNGKLGWQYLYPILGSCEQVRQDGYERITGAATGERGGDVVFAKYDEAANAAWIAFRGHPQPTTGSRRWFVDRDTVYMPMAQYNGVDIHEGFYTAYLHLQAALRRWLQGLESSPSRLHFTGHGWGAALATLAAWDLASEAPWAVDVVAWASPRVAGPSLRDRFLRLDHLRYVAFANNTDLVPLLPPARLSGPPAAARGLSDGAARALQVGFAHVAEPIHLDAPFAHGRTPSDEDILAHYSTTSPATRFQGLWDPSEHDPAVYKEGYSAFFRDARDVRRALRREYAPEFVEGCGAAFMAPLGAGGASAKDFAQQKLHRPPGQTARSAWAQGADQITAKLADLAQKLRGHAPDAVLGAGGLVEGLTSQVEARDADAIDRSVEGLADDALRLLAAFDTEERGADAAADLINYVGYGLHATLVAGLRVAARPHTAALLRKGRRLLEYCRPELEKVVQEAKSSEAAQDRLPAVPLVEETMSALWALGPCGGGSPPVIMDAVFEEMAKKGGAPHTRGWGGGGRLSSRGNVAGKISPPALVSDPPQLIPHCVSDPLPRSVWDHRSAGQPLSLDPER